MGPDFGMLSEIHAEARQNCQAEDCFGDVMK